MQAGARGKAARLQGYGKGRAGGDIGKSPDSDGVIAHREALRECFEWTMVMSEIPIWTISLNHSNIYYMLSHGLLDHGCHNETMSRTLEENHQFIIGLGLTQRKKIKGRQVQTLQTLPHRNSPKLPDYGTVGTGY